MPEKDVVVKEAITSVIGTSRLGRRKVIVKVQKKHPGMGAAKIRRVYQKEGFSLYKRMKKRRVDNPANPIEVPLSPNIEWAMDFMSDSLANGKKFRTLNIIDQYNRKCLKIGINFTLPSRKVIEIIERTIDEYGKPLGIRTDNGPEFTSCLFQNWLDKNEIEWVKIQKGKPQQNAIVERFNRTYREDILDANLFFSLDHVYEVTQTLENELLQNSDWEKDAAYNYYDHGPLARTEIGEVQLQGFDYIYNLQGWMKGINAIENEKDPGQDGLLPNGTTNNPNALFAKDAGAFSLEYFNSDYQSISGSVPISTVASGSHPAANSAALYNGNIRYMQTRLTNVNTHDAMPMLNAYKYDQLNRLNESRSYENGLASNTWSPSSYNNAYYNAFTYDAMGNILTQQRHKRDGTKIEEMSYQYQYANGKLQRNRLYHINDGVASNMDATDIDDMGAFDPTVSAINQNNNYSYDEEGRLVKDVSEQISKITWRVDGKVKEIQRGADTSKRFIRFDYDAMGHRIAKHVYDNTGIVLKKSTYYILDAQGNQIAMYEHLTAAQTVQYNLIEKNIFGSARLGTKEEKTNMLTAAVSPFKYTRTLGWKKYEFSNHLGNVLAVFCDVKVPLDNNTDGTVDAYRVCLQNVTDYSPFGAALDGRTMQGDGYRYSFQGQEHDDEVKGEGNSVNYKYRMHDPRVGRFFAVDPLAIKYPYWSPYAFSGNIVIHAREFEGLEAIIGISMGGDVDYRKGHLEVLQAGSVTTSIVSPNQPTDPSEINQLVDVLSTATANDPNGMIGFVALWGHGYGGNVYGSQGSTDNPTGYLSLDDLEGLRDGIADGSIVFNENAVILITACNAGTDITVHNPDGTTRTTSFAQELADITGVRVIAGRNVSGDGGVSPLKETRGVEMSYQMRHYRNGSFFQFQSGQNPVDIGNTYDTATGIKQGTSLPANNGERGTKTDDNK